jgi:hypothetical protein
VAAAHRVFPDRTVSESLPPPPPPTTKERPLRDPGATYVDRDVIKKSLKRTGNRPDKIKPRDVGLH